MKRSKNKQSSPEGRLPDKDPTSSRPMMFKNRLERRSEDMRRFATVSIDDESTEDGKRLTSCPATPLPIIFCMNGIPVTAAKESVDGGIF